MGWLASKVKKGKGSPYSITDRRVSELIPVLGSQPANDVIHKPSGRLPLLSARPAVTPATLKRAATNFCCLVNKGTMGVNSLLNTVTRQRRDCDLNPGLYAPESSTLTTRLPSHPEASKVSRYLSILCPCTQAGDVRDGKPGPNTRVKMFVHDVQTNTRVPLEPPPQYTDVYATCLATTPPVRGR